VKRYVLLFCLLAVLVLAVSFGASAQSTPDIPDDIQVFYVDGKTIVRDTTFGTMIYWCTGECGEDEDCDECRECPTPTPPTKTPTPPTDTPTPPTDTPTPPTPTDTPPPPPPKPKANCGLGNLEEGADPNENACGKKTGEENEPDGPPGQGKKSGG